MYMYMHVHMHMYIDVVPRAHAYTSMTASALLEAVKPACTCVRRRRAWSCQGTDSAGAGSAILWWWWWPGLFICICICIRICICGQVYSSRARARVGGTSRATRGEVRGPGKRRGSGGDSATIHTSESLISPRSSHLLTYLPTYVITYTPASRSSAPDRPL